MKRSLLESAFKEKTLIGVRTNADACGSGGLEII
jgi:hypothetical protein